MTDTRRIGFIGMGLMGVPMSLRLLQAGIPVNVWNRNPAKTEKPRSLGANACSTLHELVANSEIIALCVSDTAAVETLVFDPKGFAQYLRPGQTIVDFSSIAPKATQRISHHIKHQYQCQWLDAPVSGGVAGAESGALVMMVGGDSATLDELTPVLQPLAKRITYMGPSGSGQTTKVCNQMLVSCNVLVMAEVLALAEKAGVDARKIPSALEAGFADSIPLQITGSRMVNSELDDVKWHISTLLKDLNIASDMASENLSQTPMASLAQKLMQQQAESGLAEKDPANLITRYRHDS